LIDTPPVTADYMHGQLLGLVRGADGVAIVVDLSADSLIEDTEVVFQTFRDRHVEFVRSKQQRTRDRVPAVVFANKIDAADAKERLELLREMIGDRLEIVPISAESRDAGKVVSDFLFTWLQIIRVYTKAPGEKTKIEKPYTLFAGETVGDLCRQVHQDFYEKLQFAKLWRNGAGPLTVSKHEELMDRDIVELHM
jgi:ribosome-interacting GTPase 1